MTGEVEGTVALQIGEIKQELQSTPDIAFQTGDIQPVKTTTGLPSRPRTTPSEDIGQPDSSSIDRSQPKITTSTSDLVTVGTVGKVVTEQTTRDQPVFTTEVVKERKEQSLEPERVTTDMITDRITTGDTTERFTEYGRPGTAGKSDRATAKFTTKRRPEAITTEREPERVTQKARPEPVTADIRPEEITTDGRPEEVTADGEPESVTSTVRRVTKEWTTAAVPTKARTAESTEPSFVSRQLFKSRRDIVFVLDSSRYVSAADFRKSLNYVKLLLQPADIDGDKVRVSVITYSTKSSTQFDLGSYSTKSQIFDAIDRIAYTPGSSSMASALRGVRRDVFPNGKGNRVNVPNVAVLVVGSVSDTKKKWVAPASKAIKRRGVSVYGVSARLQDTAELMDIVSEPATESVFSVNSFDELYKTRIALTQKIFGGMYVVFIG